MRYSLLTRLLDHLRLAQGFFFRLPQARPSRKRHRPRLEVEALEPRCTPSGTPPEAATDWYSILHDQMLTESAPGILGNDMDMEQDPLTAYLVSGPSQGSLNLNSDGSFTYEPPSGFAETVSFTYQAFDGTSYSEPATVIIDVINTPPMTGEDWYSILHDQPLNETAPGILGNDADMEGDNLTASLVSGPAQGSFTLNSDGSFNYVPPSGFAGTVSFTYEAYDGIAYSQPATVIIEVINVPPTANADWYSILHGQTLTVSAPGVLDNDTDMEGDTLTAELVSGPAHGSLTLNSDGSFIYDPNPGFAGTDSFTYQAFDSIAYSNPATVTIDVINTPPMIDSVFLDNYSPKTNDLLTATVSATDMENDPIAFTYVWSVNGVPVQTTVTGTTTDSLDLGQPGFGDKWDTITVAVTASDGLASSAPMSAGPATVANSPPVLTNPGNQDFIVGDEVSLPILATDADGDMLSFSAENLPPGLTIDPYSGVISGTVQEADGTYPVRIRVWDGTEEDQVNPFFQVANIAVTNVVFVNPVPGSSITLPGDGMPSTFTFRVNGTGTPGSTGTFYWNVIEPNLWTQDKYLWRVRPFEVTVDQNGTWTHNGSFYLFSSRNGTVVGPDDSSGQTTTDPIYVSIQTIWSVKAVVPVGQRITVSGTANAPSGSTSGAEAINSMTATITPPPGFNGNLDKATSAYQVFTLTVTIFGTPGATVSNLRWSLIEPDSGLNWPNDELVYEREFSITIGADGQGTYTTTFILFANYLGQVGGVDESSGEKDPNPIYVLIEESNGSDVGFSNSITVHGV